MFCCHRLMPSPNWQSLQCKQMGRPSIGADLSKVTWACCFHDNTFDVRGRTYMLACIPVAAGNTPPPSFLKLYNICTAGFHDTMWANKQPSVSIISVISRGSKWPLEVILDSYRACCSHCQRSHHAAGA